MPRVVCYMVVNECHKHSTRIALIEVRMVNDHIVMNMGYEDSTTVFILKESG